MSSSERVIAYLQGKVNSLEDAALAENFQLLENYYDNKLWNQLSEASKQLVNDPNFVKSVNLDEFYENFIKDFEHRIQKLQLVELIIPIAQNKFLKDKEAAFEFLSKFEKMVEEDKKASVRLLSGEIELHLQDKNPSTSKCKDLAPIRKLIEKTEEKLNQLTEVGPVHASFYKVSAAYQQQVGDYARYYTESLRYLGCEDFSKLSLDQKREHALLLCVAALLGQSVYNFGELLAHPILKTLEGSQKAWLVEVLNALNEGNWDVFQKHKQKLEQEIPDFKAKIPMLEEKLRLLSLMEIAVKLPPKHRNLSFEKIAKATHLDVESLAVELLVMKALANKLLEGSIDQVSRSVNVTWVQPRVLSPAQLLVLADRMNDWRQGVNKVGSCMESQARDIVVTYT